MQPLLKSDGHRDRLCQSTRATEPELLSQDPTSLWCRLLFFHRPSYLSTRHAGKQFVEDFNLKFAMSLIPEAENALHCTIISSVMLQIVRTEATDLILGGRLIMPIAVVMWISHLVGSPERTMAGWVNALGSTPLIVHRMGSLPHLFSCEYQTHTADLRHGHIHVDIRICLSKQSVVWRFNEFHETSSLSSLCQGFPCVKCVKKTLHLWHGCNAIREKVPETS